MGKGSNDYVPEADEIILDVPDDYESLPFKTHGAVKWAFEKGYTAVFKTDDETYVRWDRLLHAGSLSDTESQPAYSGKIESNGAEQWCNGGPGYWLRGDAIACIANASPVAGAEDKWVASVLRNDNINAANDSRYSMPGRGRDYPRPDNDIITFTGCCSIDGAPTMYEIHRQLNEITRPS